MHFRFRPEQKHYMCNFEKNVQARELGSSAFLPHNPPIMLAHHILPQYIRKVQKTNKKSAKYNLYVIDESDYHPVMRLWLSGRTSLVALAFLVVPAFCSFLFSRSFYGYSPVFPFIANEKKNLIASVHRIASFQSLPPPFLIVHNF
jgi:hypothetical protein